VAGRGRGGGRSPSATWARARAAHASVGATWPVARATSRACRGCTTPPGRPAAAKALGTARSRPPVASRTIRGGEGLEPLHARRHLAGLVGDGPAVPSGAQGHVPLGFGHSHPAQTWQGTHPHSWPPALAETGARAPHNCPGSGRPGRDDPRDAPVSAAQGSTGLSRPGTACRGVPHVTYNKDTRLLAVACKRWLGASAAAPPHMWKEQASRCVSCYPPGETVGRRDRPRIGAVCPFVRLVSGGGDHITRVYS